MELDAKGWAGRPDVDAPVQRRSFEEFYDEHATTTAAVVVALRGRHVDVADVVQEAFVRALRRWDEVATMDRPDLWVQRVALNLATSKLRRLAAEARAIARLSNRVGAAPHPQGMPDGDEEFWAAVRSLPPQQARAVALRYAADLSVVDVAAVLGVAEGTAKAHLHRARQRMAELMTSAEAPEETR